MTIVPEQQIEPIPGNEILVGPSDAPPASLTLPPLISDFLQQHPGLVLTLGYLLLTGIGITYEVQYYRLFHIPILNFSEPGDFILAGFRQPVLLLLFILSVLLLRRLIIIDFKSREKSLSYRRMAEKMERSRWYSPWFFYPLLILTYFGAGALLYAHYRATQIGAGGGHTLILELNTTTSNAKPNVNEPAQLLIGTNSKFLFLYSLTEGKVHVVPIASVSRMTVGSAVQETPLPEKSLPKTPSTLSNRR